MHLYWVLALKAVQSVRVVCGETQVDLHSHRSAGTQWEERGGREERVWTPDVKEYKDIKGSAVI